MGFSMTNVLFYLVGYSVTFHPFDGLGVGGSGFARYGFFLFCLASSLLLALFDRQVERFRTTFSVVVPLLVLIGILLYGIANHQTPAFARPLVSVGSLLIGLGYVWYTLNLYHLLAARGATMAVIVTIAGSIALTTVLFAGVVALVPTEGHLIGAVVVALGAALSIAAARATAPEAAPLSLAPSDSGVTPLLSKASKRKQIGQLVLVTLVLIAARGLAQSGLWGSVSIPMAGPAALPPAVGTVLLFVVVSVPTFMVYVRHRRGYQCHLPFLVLIAGFFLVMLTTEHMGDQPAFSVLESSVELLCQMLYSFTLVQSARLLQVSGFKLAGFTLSFAYLLVILWTAFMEGTGFASSVVILAVTYVLVVFVATPAFSETAKRGSGEARPDVHHAVDMRSRRIAEENSLTNRETDILILLAQGRSLPYIQRELVLAEGTVKTHVGHIYKKLRVHSKQELIDLLSEGPMAAEVEALG